MFDRDVAALNGVVYVFGRVLSGSGWPTTPAPIEEYRPLDTNRSRYIPEVWALEALSGPKVPAK